MYYRYSSKKGSGKLYKFILFILILGLSSYFIYKYSDLLMFWRHNITKFEKDMHNIENINNYNSKLAKLDELIKSSNEYKSENSNSPEAYYINARVNFLLGESFLGRNFTNIIISESQEKVNEKAKSAFLKVIKNVKKGIALDDDSFPGDDIIVILLKSYYYSDFYSPKDLLDLLNKIREPGKIKRYDDKRFYGYMKILSGFEDIGLEYILKFGDVKKTVEGKLFLASTYSYARRYTKAIMEYQNLLDTIPDMKYKNKILLKLSDIFNNQSLYEEALKHLFIAKKSDVGNIIIIKKIAKTYEYMGEKKNARVYWKEILKYKKNDEEARLALSR